MWEILRERKINDKIECIVIRGNESVYNTVKKVSKLQMTEKVEYLDL